MHSNPTRRASYNDAAAYKRPLIVGLGVGNSLSALVALVAAVLFVNYTRHKQPQYLPQYLPPYKTTIRRGSGYYIGLRKSENKKAQLKKTSKELRKQTRSHVAPSSRSRNVPQATRHLPRPPL